MRVALVLLVAEAASAAVAISGASTVAPRTVAAGATITLTGGTQRWRQVSGPDVLRFVSPTSASTSVWVPVAGEYVVNGDGTNFTFGAVAYNVNGSIKLPTNADKIFGEVAYLGGSPWPELDERHVAMADHYSAFFLPTSGSGDANWNGVDITTALAGTVAVTNTGTTVTGTGSNFQVDFCGGGTTAAPGVEIAIWYNVPGGGTGLRSFDVLGCPSATSLTLEAAISLPTQSGVQYSKVNCGGCWYGGSTNINYYDGVLAYYDLYYRSGLTRYLTVARWLAGKYWNYPLDQGRNQWYSSPGPLRLPARNLALIGIMWNWYETGSGDWVRLETALDSITVTSIGDVREDGYYAGYFAVASLLDPDATRRAKWAGKANAIAALFAAAQEPSGGIPVRYFGYSSWNSFPTTCNVTNGSTSVTCPGGGFTENSFFFPVWRNQSDGGIFSNFGINGPGYYERGNVIFTSDVSGTTFDSRSYKVTFVNSTTLTLSDPYEGATATGKGWAIGDIVGRTYQSFQHGLAASMMYMVSNATGSGVAKSVADKLVGFMTSTDGFDAANKSVRYQGPGPACQTPYAYESWRVCTQDPNSPNPHGWGDAAYLSTEVMRACTFYKKLGGTTATIIDNCEAMIARSWGAPMGGPGSDPVKWAFEFGESTIPGAAKMKNYGFPFGMGGATGWPSMRLGGQTTTTSTIRIGVPDTYVADIRMVDGTVKTNLTCAANNCSTTFDSSLQRIAEIRFRRGEIGAPGTYVGPWQ